MILAWYLDHYLYTATSKNLKMKSRWQFMANLEQPRSLILWPTMPTFSLIKIFYLAKAEDRTKQPLAQSSSYCFEKFLPKKACFFVKKRKMLILANLRESYIFSNYICVMCLYLRTKFEVSHISHREKAPPNKTQALAKSMNMAIWAAGTLLNQLIIRSLYTKIQFSKK